MKKSTSLFLGLCFLLVSVGSALAQNVLVDTQKSYSNIKSIEVNGGWLDVSYEGGNSSSVEVSAYLASNDTDQDIIFVTVGDVLKISLERKVTNYSWNNRNKGYIKITGPEAMQLDFKNSSGTLEISRVASSKTSLKVSSGKVSASEVKGDLIVKASSGNLYLNDITGNVFADLTSGNADIMGIQGDVEFQATSGSLTAEEVNGKLSASFTSGNAKLVNVSELGTLKFTSGNVRASNSGLGNQTVLEGTSGNFTIQTPSNLKAYNFSLKASSGNLKVGSISTGKTLEVSNGASATVRGSISSGNITIQN